MAGCGPRIEGGWLEGIRIYKNYKRQLSAWGIPALYAGVAMAAALIFPEHETRIFPGLAAALSVSAATAIFSSVASGMISLTGIVFSLTFVMVQFSATAYSPRLVIWIARDPVMSHALGVFTATFLYAIAALAGVDRSGSGRVPLISTVVVAVLLLASVGMFIALIQRIGLLQINRMLVFTGDQGRKAIVALYSPLNSEAQVMRPEEFPAEPRMQTLVHDGAPQSLQQIDAAALVTLAKESGGVIEVVAAVGDTVLQSMPLMHILGAPKSIEERRLRNAIELGEERTFEQDPKYAIRLLVDIAIKALSPAVNDPTTAVQALDQIQDLLLRLGQSSLEIGAYRDSDGRLRLVVPFPTWGDLLRLALDEILFCGATSVQVMRRMNALVTDLTLVVPKERRSKIEYWGERLKTTIARSFVDGEARLEALKEDRQGLGMPRQRASGR
jgi:uncharacterized membrane protein